MAELAEAALEVFVEERIEDGVQAAVDIAQGDAEVHEHHRLNADQVESQRPRQGHDLDGCPTNSEGRDYHQDHARDAPKVAIFLLGPRKDSDTMEALHHEAVADADDRYRNQEGEQENACPEHWVPITVRIWENQDALNACVE